MSLSTTHNPTTHPPTATRRVAVLSYHKVGPPSPGAWETWFYVSESIFVRQLHWLKDNHWSAITIEQFIQGLSDPNSLPEKSVLLTFDDGYRSLLTVVGPILQSMKIPGVVFVPTDLVGTTNVFDKDVEPTEPLADWDELKKLQSMGLAIESHTATHPRLSKVSPAQRREELLRSRDAIQRRLSRAPVTLAYPYGDDAAGDATLLTDMRSAGYAAGFLYNGPVVTLPTPEPMRIPRLAMGPDTDLAVALGA
jgi:peptidoglycan/xylan/chitin deacetylase (PgdA/CDA1 family)